MWLPSQTFPISLKRKISDVYEYVTRSEKTSCILQIMKILVKLIRCSVFSSFWNKDVSFRLNSQSWNNCVLPFLSTQLPRLLFKGVVSSGFKFSKTLVFPQQDTLYFLAVSLPTVKQYFSALQQSLRTLEVVAAISVGKMKRKLRSKIIAT